MSRLQKSHPKHQTNFSHKVFTGGAFFGSGAAGYFGDKFGRKWTILIGAATFCLGGGLQTGAQNIGYMMAGRALSGAG